MAKVTQEQRSIYQQQIKIYKNKIDEIGKEINVLKVELSKDKSKEGYTRFKIANQILNEITLYCSLNEISLHLLGVKNTAFLEKARQQVYESIMNVEKVVTSYIDVPFNEYEEQLQKLSMFSDTDKLNFLKKLGYSIDLVKENFGENTKWKWSFVEIEARFGVIAKNTFNLKRFQSKDDPREEGYRERREHFNILQKLLLNGSQGYRDKFEFSTKDVEDLKKAIDFQKSLLRINQLTGDDTKIEKCKKQVEVWSNILEKHLAQIEEEKKNRALRK